MEPYKATDRWRYYALPLDSDRTPFPVYDPLLAIWQGKRRGRTMPAWSDFDITDFVGWHRHLILYQVMRDPFDLHYRLFGSFPTDVYGENLTGKTMRTSAPEIETEVDLTHFRKLADSVLLGASSGTQYWTAKEFITMAYLDLPLSDDGETVTHFLTGALNLDRPPDGLV